MEDIAEKEVEGQEVEEADVLTIFSKMGAEETKIRELIVHLYESELNGKATWDEIHGAKSLADRKAGYRKLAGDLATGLRKQFGSKWNVMAGERFQLNAFVSTSSRYASFKIKDINVMVYED